ncbi:hypothetical protein MPH_10976 [Macrophomina phaseolina MS6]|uniref:Uncharacterized protein n=2 Tax=Macrophomina phaseolina TaxID=35725 RepID=K2RG91_MACPH|nr:hypothetical protein MPH_10976 [Macrophomina phaseolina MS6]KAH7057426.1 hypothetical protein B0J12DRAFT_654574 [Macrophomina phaseolina]
MDFVKNLAGGSSEDKKPEQEQKSSGGFMDKLNGMAGGGRESEKNEDALDKGVDFVQEKFLGQGPQDNESAIEQAKDEQISDFIRSKYKATTGSDFPIADKDKKYGS